MTRRFSNCQRQSKISKFGKKQKVYLQINFRANAVSEIAQFGGIGARILSSFTDLNAQNISTTLGLSRHLHRHWTTLPES